MADQNLSSTGNQPISGNGAASKKLVMWLVIAAIPVGILIYAFSHRSSSGPLDVDDYASSKSDLADADDAVPTKSETPLSSDSTSSTTPTQTPATKPEQAVGSSTYKDGSYSATGTYMSPGGAEEVGVTLTLKNGIVTDSVFEAKASRPASVNMQNQFAAGYKQYVVGKKLADINVRKVSGSSLTPQGFNDAVAKIKVQAQS